MDSSQRKRISKACDSCSKKRKKCSGEQPCSNCSKFGRECTYTIPAKKRGPAPGSLPRKRIGNDSSSENHTHHSNRSDDRMSDSFSTVNPLSLNHHRETQIPRLSTAFLETWTYDSFPPLQLKNGLYLPWTDVYFEYVNPRYPIFPKKWFLEAHQDMPMFLLHVMYAMTLLTPQLKNPKDAAESSLVHYRYCQVLQEEWMESPGLFSLIATYMFGFYCYVKPTSLMDGLTNMNLATRGAVQIGLVDLNFPPWKAKSGKVYSLQDPTIKVMACVFFTMLYEQDGIIGFYRNFSFSLPFDNPAIDDFEENLIDYNFYYNSGLWRYHVELTKIGKRITEFCREVPHNFDTDPQWLKTYNQLTEMLAEWRMDLPPKMHDVGSTMNTATPSRWKLEYSKSEIALLVICHAKFYWYSIVLHRPMFLHILSSNGNFEHISVVKSVDAGRRIEHLMKVIVEIEVRFDNLPPFFSIFMFFGSATLCMSTKIYGPSEGLSHTVNLCISHIESCGYCPTYRAENLKKWLHDPMSGIIEFASAL